jgi:hypothetical protein
LYSELWQFAGMVGFFVIALILWLRIVYLPGRTLERWEDQRVEAKKRTRREDARVEDRDVRDIPR